MKRKQAFTLIELLIVIVIVAMLAVLALASFSAARQKARMDITADALVSAFKQQQSLARSGRGGIPTCYGIYFNMDDPKQVYTVEAPYVSVDSSIDVTRADFCDMRQGKFTVTRFEPFEDNKISELSKFGMDVRELMVLFRPPEAKALVGDMGVLEVPQVTDNSSLTVTFESASGQEKRAVKLDVSSGLAERVEVLSKIKPLKPLTPVSPSIKNKLAVPVKTTVSPTLKQVSP